jgi:fimbrial chaperone protein
MPRILLLTTVLSVLPAPLLAATYTVNPTRVYLSARATSALMTLKNESETPLRMQLRAQRWAQTRAGEMQLADTEDLIVFPSLLTLKPGEERKVRVATTAPFGQVEQSYRLSVEELPAAAPDAPDGASVRIITRMGIPVFLQPPRPAATAVLQGLGLSNGALAFELANTGNTHYIPESVVVRGFTAAGQPVGEWPLSGWYVLAGGVREFSLKLPRPACDKVRSLLVEVTIGQTLLKGPLTTPGGACAPD